MRSSTEQTDAERHPHRSGEQALRPRARFLRTFGDELISSETVALIELVKNSFDADATRILVRFTLPLETGRGEIEVIDNGHGMALDTIQTAWMEPATLLKRQRTRSEGFGRRVLGEKGIGRFATSRLAKRLDVITKRAESSSQTRVRCDWTKFDDPSLFLDQVKVSWHEEGATQFSRLGIIRALWGVDEDPTAAELEHGTILRMQDLNSNWDKDEFERLKSGLSRLVSPFFGQRGEDEYRLSNGFDIRLEVPDPFSEFSGLIGAPDTLESPHYSLNGNVDKYGRYEVIVRLKGREETERVSSPPSTEPIPTNCGPFGIQLRVWDRDPASMGDLARTRESTIRDVRRDLDAMAGISVYRDGFRVLPYGERGDDWLGLDLRRVQNPTLRLSNNQIVGYVLVGSDTNPLLKDQTNREGLVEGPAVNELRLKVKELLTVIEPRRYNLRAGQRQSKVHKGGIFMGFELADISTYVRKRYPDNAELIELVREKASDLRRRVEEVQEVLARYHRLATLGTLVDTVLHDGRPPLSKISNEAYMGRRDLERSHQFTTSSMERLRKRLHDVGSQAKVLERLFRRIEPFGGRKRGRRARLGIERLIGDGFSVLSSKTAVLGVKVDLPKGSTKFTVESSEFQEIIVNLLDNSLYWLQQVEKEDRQIKVIIDRSASHELHILFSDSGPGVDEEFVDRIFDPYFSTKPDGVGLGLSIAGGIVRDYYDGELELLKSGPLPGATFRISLRKRE